MEIYQSVTQGVISSRAQGHKPVQVDHFIISMDQESRHSLARHTAPRSRQAVIQVLVGAVVSSEV